MLDTLARYSWNSYLGASLYPTLLHLEVAFRNRLHDAVASRYPIGPWQDVDCWLGRVPPILAPSEFAQVQVATDRLRRTGKPITPGRVVAELTFGFWTNLLDVRYEQRQVLWPPLLEKAFPHLPAVHRTRRVVAKRFNMLRRLRNRVFHYEPIWHWRDLSNQHEMLLEAISWLSPSYCAWRARLIVSQSRTRTGGARIVRRSRPLSAAHSGCATAQDHAQVSGPPSRPEPSVVEGVTKIACPRRSRRRARARPGR
jgi:hypothetical protein